MILGMHTLLTHTRRSPCNTLTVQVLHLYENQIGDAGVTALANALIFGSFCPAERYEDDGANGAASPSADGFASKGS